jgi:bla regulator protein blaR1
MTAGLLGVLANLGAGALLASAALLLFTRLVALRFIHDPASSHRALVWALALAAALMLVPPLRAMLPHGAAIATATASIPPQVAPVDAATSYLSALGFYVLCALGAAWLLAAALAAAAACVSLIQLGLLIRRAHPAPASITGLVGRCSVRGAAKIRRVLVSDEASVPFAAIPWSPVLVVPATYAGIFDGPALELMIAHEATHLERRDLWTTALVRALCVLFPFNPVAARVSDDIAFAREAAVDARVSARDPHGYATLLLDVAANARFDQLPRPVSMDDTALQRRIAMLTDESKRRSLSLAPLTIAATILAAATLAAILRCVRTKERWRSLPTARFRSWRHRDLHDEP